MTVAYGATGSIASVTDARSGQLAYAYDKMDRLSTYTDALTHVATINTRDGLGEILKATDRKGQIANYTYDALNRPATATYTDGSTVSYTFDLGGRLTKVVDSVGGTVTRAYDGLDRLTSETSAQGTVTYTYDAASRLATLQAPNQALITYGYDNDNRLTSITQGTASVAFGYDNASRRTSGTTPSGSWAYTYDAASQLTQIAYTGYAGGSLGTLTYTYGLDGSVTSRGGTLFTSVLPAAVTSAAYNAGNRLTSRVTSAGTQTPVFDANGSLTSDGINSFTWDPRNRMTAIGSQASFVYDAFGRRASVTKSGGAPIGYLYSGDDVIQEQQSGAVLAQMLTGLGIDERYVRAGELILNDLLGSTVALSNGSTIQTSYAYDPYGVTTTAGAATTNTYQFTGRENDGTTAGLMFYRARYYNPSWGRFVSEDPIGVAGGVNLYAYVGGSPTNRKDPRGLCDHVPNGCSNLPGFSQFELAASLLFKAIPSTPGTPPWLRGIDIHTAFSGVVSQFPNTSVNVSYLGGFQSGYQVKGSSTPDAVYGNIKSPDYVVELKTSNAQLVNPQLDNYLLNLPPGTPLCVITEN